MINEKFHSLKVSRDTKGTATTRVYHGSRAEMETLAAEHRIDETDDPGRLKGISLRPSDGTVWECEFKYEAPDGWKDIVVPPRDWGKRSCRLRGATLSLPLESHPGYRTRWKYFLCAAPGTGSLPEWYREAADTLVPLADAEKYCWCRTISEVPCDANGRWKILAAPAKPGVDSYDAAVYSIIETARFRSAAQAGQMVSGTLNRIGSPANNFGITGGNWKCDDAEVSWHDDCWVARLTWTRSAENSGWDSDIYGDGSQPAGE